MASSVFERVGIPHRTVGYTVVWFLEVRHRSDGVVVGRRSHVHTHAHSSVYWLLDVEMVLLLDCYYISLHFFVSFALIVPFL